MNNCATNMSLMPMWGFNLYQIVPAVHSSLRIKHQIFRSALPVWPPVMLLNKIMIPHCICVRHMKLYLQGQLRSAQASLQEWRNAFQSIAANAGLALEPSALLAHLQQTHQQPATTTTSGNTPTEDISVLRQRESQLQAQLMEKILENMELRRHLQASKAAAEPNVVQVYLFASPMHLHRQE